MGEDICNDWSVKGLIPRLYKKFTQLNIRNKLLVAQLSHIWLLESPWTAACPSLSPEVCSNSCPLSQWCHPTISFLVTLFSSCPQSFPPSGTFPMSCFFVSAGQSIAASASASVLPMNIHGWFPLGSTGLIFLQSKGLLRAFSSTTVGKHQFFSGQPSL